MRICASGARAERPSGWRNGTNGLGRVRLQIVVAVVTMIMMVTVVPDSVTAIATSSYVFQALKPFVRQVFPMKLKV
jgi:hypothetical protein